MYPLMHYCSWVNRPHKQKHFFWKGEWSISMLRPNQNFKNFK